jgi:hypothetical protein
MILRSDSRPRTRLVLKQKKIKQNSIMTSSFKKSAKSSANCAKNSSNDSRFLTKTQGYKKRTGKDKLVQIVDSEISFNFKPNPKRTKSDSVVPTPLFATNNNVETPTAVSEKPEFLEFVDDEISFNFNTPKKTEPRSEIKTEKEIEWLKTMVIIYDIIFDIKTEKKDDYEEEVNLYPKKKKKRRRFGRY